MQTIWKSCASWAAADTVIRIFVGRGDLTPPFYDSILQLSRGELP